jgi:hypothetical protein
MTIKLFARVALAGLLLALTGCFGPIERPTADFTWCPDGSAGGLDYWFTSASSTVPGHWIASMHWEFGDDSLPETMAWEAWHRFREAGIYPVTLTVTDSRGVSDAVTKSVPVSPAARIDPNWQLVWGSRTRATGIVANQADVRLHSVVVKAKFYDVDDVRITDGIAVLEDLRPGERVAFAVDASEPSARIVRATVEVDSFAADCPNGWHVPCLETPHE